MRGGRHEALAPAAATVAPLPHVRWLATRVLGDDSADLLRRVPAPCLVSDHPPQFSRAVRDYASWWVRHPAPGGAFAAKTRWLRWLPAPWPMRILKARGYDGLLYPHGDAICGHVFFQRHGSDLHGFSTAVHDPLTGAGCSVVMVLDYVAYAAQLRGVVRARVGQGRNNTTRRLLMRLRRHEDALGWHVAHDGWISFGPARSEAATRITARES